MSEQEQFLQVLDRDEAERRFRAAIDLTPVGIEKIPLDTALGRVLAADVISPVDVPSFDRSNVDGFAVVAEDTFGASEEVPRSVRLVRRRDSHGRCPGHSHPTRQGRVNRDRRHGSAWRRRSRYGRARGDTRLRATNRQGRHSGQRHIVCRDRHHRGRDGSSSGDAVDQPRHGGARRDRGRESQRLAKADRCDSFNRRRDHRARRCRCSPPRCTIPTPRFWPTPCRNWAASHCDLALPMTMSPPYVNGFVMRLRSRTLCSCRVERARAQATFPIGWSPNSMIPVSSRTASRSSPVSRFASQSTQRRAVVVLPGFPTSAIFTFHEFVAPVIRLLAGRGSQERTVVPARLAVKVNSEIGRTEYLLVGLVETPNEGLCGVPDGPGVRQRHHVQPR